MADIKDNYSRYWRNWNVLQTPKFDVDAFEKAGWSVNDVNKGNERQTLIYKDDKKLRITYFLTGGVRKITAKVGDTVVKSEIYSCILKPTLNDIKRFLWAVGIEDWQKFLTTI